MAFDRRTFLRRFGFGTVSAAAAVLTFDVEKLLWVPGEKTIFLPPEPSILLIDQSNAAVIREMLGAHGFRSQFMHWDELQVLMQEFMRRGKSIVHA